MPPPRPQQPPYGEVPPNWQFPNQGGTGQPPYGPPPLMGQIQIPRPPGPGRRRKPRRRPWGLVAGVLVLLVVIVGTTLAFVLRGDDQPEDTAGPGPDVSSTPSDTPSPTPTPTPSLTPTPTPKPKPKPNPVPKQPTALQLVTQNRLYSTGRLNASRCREPKWRPINPNASRAYYHTLVSCMNKSWYVAMRRAGVRFRSPKVVVYAGVLRTPCGTERASRGYYCGVNETIYLPYTLDFNYYKANPVYGRAWMAHTFAHEYGHHVQQMTGILDASWRRQRQHRTPAGALQESRRRELQASCLGNVYLGTNRNWFPINGQLMTMWDFIVTHSGDEYSNPRVRDHGSRLNHGWWSKRGFFSYNPGLCNTFTASARVTN